MYICILYVYINIHKKKQVNHVYVCSLKSQIKIKTFHEPIFMLKKIYINSYMIFFFVNCIYEMLNLSIS